MTRPVADTPSFPAAISTKEKESPLTAALPLEFQLWIEVSLLMILGLIMIYSASSISPLGSLVDNPDHLKSTAHYLQRQLFCIGLGTGIIMLVRIIPYNSYKTYGPWMLIGVIAALLLVLIPGIGAEINNARRWFRLKIFLLQPAEYAKVFWVIFLSVSLAKKRDRVKQIAVGFLPHIIWCGILALLMLLEPDFGTPFMLGCLTVIMLAVGGVPFRHLFILLPIATLGIYKFVYKVPYRWERITAFMNPWTDPLDTGYQLIQAWIAVGSGGMFGKGLGASHQKLFYLPESFTDFILAVVGEELGFVGILAISALFFLIFRTGMRISRYAPDFHGTLLAMGLTMMLALQALLNMGVVLGLVPTKGLPLPFVSYGGSAFTANCFAIGILMNIARSSERRIG
ncbi:MAG: putative lipid II flippase FtsW [Syntrophobacteraceae bacterium]